MATATFTTKEIILNDHEIFMIKNHGGLCLASSEEVLRRSRIDFDDVERLNGVFKNYKWGSDKDIRYRKSSLKNAIDKFSRGTLQYITSI